MARTLRELKNLLSSKSEGFHCCFIKLVYQVISNKIEGIWVP